MTFFNLYQSADTYNKSNKLLNLGTYDPPVCMSLGILPLFKAVTILEAYILVGTCCYKKRYFP